MTELDETTNISEYVLPKTPLKQSELIAKWNSFKTMELLTVIDAIASAIAAGFSAYITSETSNQFQVAQRAYVVFEGIQINGTPGVQKPIIQTAQVKNVGLTPALNLRVIFVTSTSTEIPEYVNFAESSQINLGSGLTQLLNSSDNVTLPADTLNMILTSKVRLYLISKIQYNDIFGKVHNSTVCSYFEPEIYKTSELLTACKGNNEMN